MSKTKIVESVQEVVDNPDISQEELRSLFDYDEETGHLVNKVKRSTNSPKGKRVGWIQNEGYRKLCIRKNYLFAHRVIWAWYYGEWPSGYIDHINGVKDDNRIKNLRVVDKRGNGRNYRLKKNNTSGVMGVSWDKRQGKWAVNVGSPGPGKFCGNFESLDEAKSVAEKVRAERGYHPDHGKPKPEQVVNAVEVPHE